jgi:hypothetical protein
MPAHVELSSKAARDLKRLGPGPERKVIIDMLRVGLVADPPPDNLDIKPLKGPRLTCACGSATIASSTGRSMRSRSVR